MAVDEKYPLALPAGTVLAGQYTIDKVLGQGGFGITYKATDYKTNGKVAVKEFFPDTLAYREMTTVISYPGERSENYEYGKEGFLQEAKTLAEFIGCENIVRIHSYFEENGTAYFVMDYIEGISFDEYLRQKGGKISCEDAKNVLIPIMDALAVVHSKGIVHRDVTPDNIYITNDGVVKLLDFGAARYSLGDKSRSLDVILKHGFAPKEQYTRRGKQGPYTDVYSLGATFYFALTGKRPPDSVERLDEDDLIPPSSLGVQITEYQEEAILMALSVQPGDRFQSMLAFKNTFLNEMASSVPQTVFTAPQQPVYAVPQQVPQTAYVAPQQPVQQVPQTAYVAPQQPVQQIPQTAYVAPQQPVQQIPPTAYVAPQQESIPLEQPATNENKPAKKLNKKALIIASSCAVLAIGVAIVSIILSNPYRNTKSDILGSDDSESSYSQSTTQTTTDFDFGSSSTPEYDFDPPISEPATESTSNVTIIGNTVGNIACNGHVTHDSSFWVDKNAQAVCGLDNNGNVYDFLTTSSGYFSNLLLEGETLYCLCDGTVFYRPFSANEVYTPTGLERYTDVRKFYLSKDYYFVYTRPHGSSYDTFGTLYRISRATGKEEQSIDIRYDTDFVFYDNFLYYIEDTGEENIIHMVSSLDFTNEIRCETLYHSSCDYITADNEHIYFINKKGDYSSYTYSIEKYKWDFSAYVNSYDITDIVANAANYDGYGVAYLNVKDDQAFFNAYSNLDTSPGLYHLSLATGKSNTLAPLSTNNIWGFCVLKYSDYYKIVYYENKNAKTYFVKLDLNGNPM